LDVFSSSRIFYVCDYVTLRFQHSNVTETQGMGTQGKGAVASKTF